MCDIYVFLSQIEISCVATCYASSSSAVSLMPIKKINIRPRKLLEIKVTRTAKCIKDWFYSHNCSVLYFIILYIDIFDNFSDTSKLIIYIYFKANVYTINILSHK